MKKPVQLLSTLIFFLFLSTRAYNQTFTPVYNTTMAFSSHGYYEYLPEGYNNNSEKYPLILFFHGAGEMGNGTPGQLENVLHLGLPRMMSLGTFPSSFTLNGRRTA